MSPFDLDAWISEKLQEQALSYDKRECFFMFMKMCFEKGREVAIDEVLEEAEKNGFYVKPDGAPVMFLRDLKQIIQKIKDKERLLCR